MILIQNLFKPAERDYKNDKWLTKNYIKKSDAKICENWWK